MIGKADFDNVFGEDVDWEEVIGSIRGDDYEGVTNTKDELSYNEGWYNHSIITFDYKGKRYSIDYSEHTSDNVSETEFDTDSFACLGNTDKMDQTISMEDLSKIRIGYENRIKKLNEHKDLLAKLKPLTLGNLEIMSEIFLTDRDQRERSEFEKTVGEFFVELTEMRKRREF